MPEIMATIFVRGHFKLPDFMTESADDVQNKMITVRSLVTTSCPPPPSGIDSNLIQYGTILSVSQHCMLPVHKKQSILSLRHNIEITERNTY